MNTQLSAEIEEIIAFDPGRRGIGGLVLSGDLARASQSLLFAGTVFIITGFYIKAAGRGETDGPPGAVVLGKALLAMRKKVCFVTDRFNYPIVQAAADAYGAEAEIIALPVSAGEAEYLSLLDKYRPSHIVAVERPGRAPDGRYYNMRGDDITSCTASIDTLVDFGQRRGIITIGIGDGGNEIGMGKVLSLAQTSIPEGKKIVSAVATDYLVVAGVTNWGAYGIVACLSVLQGSDLLHNGIWERKILAAIIQRGAVDGTTAKADYSIDGLPVEMHCRLVGKLKACLKRYLPQHTALPAAGN